MTEKNIKTKKSTEEVIKETKKEAEKTKKNKKMVKISFTGKELLEGRVFDTTNAEEAKKADAFDENRKYEPMTIILGENEMLPQIEKELEGMKEGEEKTVKLSPKESFGERDSKFVVVMPLKSFVDQKINPVPGLVIRGEINGQTQAGKIQSVSGGRVRVDFNHPLSGREIEYDVKLEEIVKDKKEIADALFEKYYQRIPGAKKEITKDELKVIIPKEAADNLKAVNPVIAELGSDLGVKITFKEEKEKAEKKEKKAEK